MLGGLFRIILVEDRHDPADHVAVRVVVELLRYADQSNFTFFKAASAKLELNLIAEETAE